MIFAMSPLPNQRSGRPVSIVVSGALTTGGGKPVVAIAPDVAATLTANPGGGGRRREDDTNLVAFDPETAVRRLTPLECERLQGAPDGWTAGQHDSPRYRQLGNAVAAPVFTWVGRRIVAVDARLHQREGVA